MADQRGFLVRLQNSDSDLKKAGPTIRVGPTGIGPTPFVPRGFGASYKNVKANIRKLPPGAPPPYIGPKGGLWADPGHTIHWKGQEKKQTQTPFQEEQIGARAADETIRRRAYYNPDAGMALQTFDPTSARRGRMFSGYGYTEEEAFAGLSDDWFLQYGFAENPGWNGKWNSRAEPNPGRYDLEVAREAEKSAKHLHYLRAQGEYPTDLFNAILLFLFVGSRRSDRARKKAFVALKKWCDQHEEERQVQDLESILFTWGKGADAFLASKRAIPYRELISSGMKRFPDDGPALRDWMHRQRPFMQTDYRLLSFALLFMGYNDVSPIDWRVIQSMTGASVDSATLIEKQLMENKELYRKFESTIKRIPSFKGEDPKGIRQSAATWRMWNAKGGDDDTHEIFWQGLSSLMGVRDIFKSDFQKAQQASDMSRFGVYVGLALAFVFFELGPSAPVFYDGIPVIAKFFLRQVQQKEMSVVQKSKLDEFLASENAHGNTNGRGMV